MCAGAIASHVRCACGRPRQYDGGSCAVRLQAAPERGFDPFSDPPRGEICIKGPMVFAGYYKMPDKTKEEFGGRNPPPAALCQLHSCRWTVTKLAIGDLRHAYTVCHLVSFQKCNTLQCRPCTGPGIDVGGTTAAPSVTLSHQKISALGR